MGKKDVIGHCRVCGRLAALSWEHVPPKATPNKNTHIELTFEQMIRLGPEDIPKGPQRQGGVRFPTICGRCNNKFGRWYVPALNKWYWGGRYILRQMEERGLDAATFAARNVYPLQIVKAIIAMFMAINPERFRTEPIGAALARLLDDQQAKGLPEGVSFHTYFNHTGRLRYIPVSEVKYNITKETTLDELVSGPSLHASEIAYPPYGLVMALSTHGLDPRLCDISYFADFDYEQEDTVELDLAVLPTHIKALPNDYRSLEEVKMDEQRNREAAIKQGIDPDSM